MLASVFTIATCGLVYELVAGTIASYLLGDSVTQFSTVIGVYLFAMGIGSWLSRYVEGNLLRTFIQVEFLIALFGGSSAAMFFALFPYISSFRALLYGDVLLIGTLVGLEVPLLLRILKDRLNFKDLISRVFTFDYIGALIASLLFPLVLVPYCGIARSGFLFGILNAVVGLVALWVLWDEVSRPGALRVAGIATLVLLGIGFVYSERMVTFSESAAYGEDIVFSKSTPYQRITLTRRADDIRLYLNGNLQFSSRDEYRYHEVLVHPGLALFPRARRVLVLGGGDGLAVREILRYPRIESITLVDLRSRHDSTLFNPGDFSFFERRVVQITACPCHQCRCLFVAAGKSGDVRLHHSGLPGPLEFLGWQVILHRLLPSRPDCHGGGGSNGYSMHIAVCCQKGILVRGRHPACMRLRYASLPRVCPFFRGMGIHPRLRATASGRVVSPGWAAFP